VSVGCFLCHKPGLERLQYKSGQTTGTIDYTASTSTTTTSHSTFASVTTVRRSKTDRYAVLRLSGQNRAGRREERLLRRIHLPGSSFGSVRHSRRSQRSNRLAIPCISGSTRLFPSAYHDPTCSGDCYDRRRPRRTNDRLYARPRRV